MVRGFRIFRPILAGANARDRALVCVAASIGIALIALSGKLVDGPVSIGAWVFAPIGASAVLVFAVPASPLTQPWPVIGGLFLSTLTGIVVGLLIDNDVIAAGVAVGAAIGVMSVTRTLHPPGGAAAITGVVGVHMGVAAEPLYPLLLAALDGVGIVLVGLAFHRLVSGHSYPHVIPVTVETVPAAGAIPHWHVDFRPEDIDAVLSRLDDTFDIGRDDLAAILAAVESEATHRSGQESGPSA